MRMGTNTKGEKNTMKHSADVERAAREIVIHATIIGAICTLIVMVIP